MHIQLNNITKSFDNQVVLDHLQLTIPYYQTTAIMAPSGSGKTTLLHMLMGLLSPDAGSIEGLSNLRQSVVFQEDRLCENLSALANITLPSPHLKPSTIQQAMVDVSLIDCQCKKVSELSGGMRRRVALLRALLYDYDLLILDEPFKGLDLRTKQLVIHYIKKSTAGKTVLLVTHDKEEAMAMGATTITSL